MNLERISGKLGLTHLAKIDVQESNRDAVENHLNAGGVSPLTDLQEKLLERWTFADDLMKANVGKLKKTEIANRIKDYFGISRAMAFVDIGNAEYIFPKTSPFNKKYNAERRIEFLEREIRLAAADNDRDSIAKLETILQKYIKEHPDVTPVESPKTLIFSFDVEKLTDSLIPNDERDSILNAQANANKLLDSMAEDIDFEVDEGDDDE